MNRRVGFAAGRVVGILGKPKMARSLSWVEHESCKTGWCARLAHQDGFDTIGFVNLNARRVELTSHVIFVFKSPTLIVSKPSR